MKRANLCILLAILIVFSLFACNGTTLNDRLSKNSSDAAVEKNTVVPVPTTNAPTSATTTAETTKSPTTKRVEVTNRSFASEAMTGALSDGAGTFTGYTPLSPVKFTANDPDNTRGLSTAKIAHSYGVASKGVPHSISVESQKFFDSKGFNAITYDNKSSDKVLYLTFDCGYENGHTEKIMDTLAKYNVKAAFFCTLDHIKAEPELISRMIKEGHIVGNHSNKHPSFAEINRTRMAEEIEAVENYLRENFGYSAPYFRFPKGEYSESALDLVESLGFKSVFWSLAYADWDTSTQKGAAYALDKVTSRLHPGAIILLHSVSADNDEAMADIIEYALDNGYTFKPLTQLPK